MSINQALAQIDEKENIPRRPKAKIQCKMALKQRKTSQKTENPKTYAGISAQTHKSKTLLKSTYNEKKSNFGIWVLFNLVERILRPGSGE